MTPDARFIGFASIASNLVADDTNDMCTLIENQVPRDVSCPDIFLLERETGVLERVSVSSQEEEGDGLSDFGMDVTPDGRFVAFGSDSTSLVPGDTNNTVDAFVRDRLAGTTERVSVPGGGGQTDNASTGPTISDDGRFVAFRSYATNLAGLDKTAPFFSDIYVHDRLTDQTERVSVSSDGEEGDANSYHPELSGNGRYVVFDSEATNLIPSDANGYGYGVYLHDRETGRMEQVSVNSAGVPANDLSQSPSISGNGRYVSFASRGTNLAPNDTAECDANFVNVLNMVIGYEPCSDVYILDRETGQADRVSVPIAGQEEDGESFDNHVTDDGRFVIFHSEVSRLVADDTNDFCPVTSNNVIVRTSCPDVFVADRGPGTGVGELGATVQGESVTASGWARFSGEVVWDDDPAGDAGPASRATGTDLIGARLVHRPEEADLLVRLELDRLPPAPRPPSAAQVRVASVPAVVYGLEMTVGSTRYEVRATRGVSTSRGDTSSFTLLRCAASCIEVAQVIGSIGTTGEHVNITVPLSAIGTSGPTQITGIRGFVGPGEASPGTVTSLDEVRLPPLPLSEPTVALGLAPAGTPEEDVSFDTSAALSDGVFDGSLDASTLPAGAYDVWARACLGALCGFSSSRVDLQ
jgi:Tol biopolymer transport system component